MTCDACAPLIDDLVDDALPGDVSAEVRVHLAACAGCRTLAADLGAIRSLAAALPPFVPPDHVWQTIARQTRSAPARHPLAALLTVWRPALAGAMSVVLVTGLAWLGGRLTAVTTGVPIPAGHAATPGAASVLHTPEATYSQAIASLEPLAAARRSVLEPGVAEAIASGMTIVDTAIDQSRAALRTVPDSEAARDSLLQALRTKVTLLQDALALAAGSASGDREGAVTGQAETTP